MKAGIDQDASQIVYLLDLFEGRLSLDDILNSDTALLMSMKEAKEKQIEIRNRELKKNMPKNTIKPLTPVPDSETGKQGYMLPIGNINN